MLRNIREIIVVFSQSNRVRYIREIIAVFLRIIGYEILGK